MNLGLKEIRYGKKNYFLIELTILLLVFMVIFLSGLAKGLEKVATQGLVELPKENFILNKDAEGSLSSSVLSLEVFENLKNQDDKGEGLIISRSFISTESDDSKLDIFYFAMDENGKLLPKVVEGNSLEENGILLSKKFKDKGIKLNDYIKDRNSELFLKVVGFVENTSYSYSDVAFVTLDTMLNMKKEITKSDKVSYTTFVTDKKDFNLSDSEELFTKKEIVNKLPGFNAQQKTIIAITWLLVLISSGVLGVFFYIITIQKQQQLGVMKAIGMSNFEISKVLISQIFFLSFVGIVLANILSYVLSLFLPSSMPYLIDCRGILIVSISFVLISVLSGIISILKIAKVDPLEVIGGAK